MATNAAGTVDASASGYTHADRGCDMSQRDPRVVSSALRRGGWGLVRSCEGVWPKLAIWSWVALRSVGSSMASTSTAPSYVR